VGMECSTRFRMDVGCAQGSTLGPKIFNIYVSELSSQLSSKIISYADDSYVIVCSEDRESLIEKIKREMTIHLDWLRSIGMRANPSKTECMIMNDTEVFQFPEFSTSTNMNVLGLVFDNRLKWDYQVNKCTKKTKSVIHAMRKIGKFLTTKELKRIVTSFAFPVLFYGIEVWFDPCSFRSKARVRSTYYNILRLMLRRNHWTSRATLDRISMRGNPDQWNTFCLAKLLMNVYVNKEPINLYTAIRDNSYFKSRHHGMVFMFSSNSYKVGAQSVSNRLRDVSLLLKCNWLFERSKDKLRIEAKKVSFPYYSSSFPPA